jgi:heptosyltransferase-1
MKILIIKLGALGDVINTLPLAVHIKNNLNAEITWIIEPLSFPLLENHDEVDKVFLFDKKNKKDSADKILKIIKFEKYDFVFDLQRILKSAFFTYHASAERKITFDKKRCKELTWLLPYEKIKPGDHESNHMLDQYLEFGRHIGIGVPEEIVWNIPHFADEIKIKTKKYIILNTGATKPANRWFEESFAKLSDMIYEKTDYTPVLTGGPGDINFAFKISSFCKKQPLNFTGKTDLKQLIQLIRNASFLISSDTGPMHLSVAVDTKTAALFGPSNPLRTGPYYGKIIRKNSECLNCGKKECRKNTRECMEIDPQKVFNNVFLDPWKEKKVTYIS